MVTNTTIHTHNKTSNPTTLLLKMSFMTPIQNRKSKSQRRILRKSQSQREEPRRKDDLQSNSSPPLLNSSTSNMVDPS